MTFIRSWSELRPFKCQEDGSNPVAAQRDKGSFQTDAFIPAICNCIRGSHSQMKRSFNQLVSASASHLADTSAGRNSSNQLIHSSGDCGAAEYSSAEDLTVGKRDHGLLNHSRRTHTKPTDFILGTMISSAFPPPLSRSQRREITIKEYEFNV